MLRVTLMGLLGVLAACSSSQTPLVAEPSQEFPPDVHESVLVIRVAPGGQAEYSWQPASLWNQELNGLHASTGGSTPRIVLASRRSRDCDQEQIDCHRDCMRRKPPYAHGPRRSHSHIEFCNNKCLKEYMNCLKLQELEALSFTAIDRAVDWLKRHPQEVMVGATVVAAGTAFIVIFTGPGLIVLAPLVLLT